jgi:hypothetical protein
MKTIFYHLFLTAMIAFGFAFAGANPAVAAQKAKPAAKAKPSTSKPYNCKDDPQCDNDADNGSAMKNTGVNAPGQPVCEKCIQATANKQNLDSTAAILPTGAKPVDQSPGKSGNTKK